MQNRLWGIVLTVFVVGGCMKNATAGESNPKPIEKRIHIVRDAGKEFAIRFSTANPTIDVPFGEKQAVKGIARFKGIYDKGFWYKGKYEDAGFVGGDIDVRFADGTMWALPKAWKLHLEKVGTVDLGEGEDIYFSHMEGNTQEYWHYSLINPRQKALVDLCFTWGHQVPTTVEMIASSSYYEPALSREREFLSKIAQEEGNVPKHPGENVMTKQKQDMEKAVEAWHRANPDPSAKELHSVSFAGAPPVWAIWRNSIIEGPVTYAIARSPIPGVITSYDSVANRYRVLYVEKDVNGDLNHPSGSDWSEVILKKGSTLVIGTNGSGLIFLNLDTGRAQRIASPGTIYTLADSGTSVLVNGNTRIPYPPPR